ncbi:MAG TPA: heme o synthase [Gemmataceae bacterium]|nr:heme o synthase [Gemmataceae bacterium]
MKAATTVCPDAPSLVRSRLADYLMLTKPRVAVLVLFTVACGALLAAAGAPDWVVLGHTVLGTALVAGGASALNQFLERDSDSLMWRTENRPLPAGRLLPMEVLLFGTALGGAGVTYLALVVRQPLAAVVAAITFVSYVFVYTPLKRRTTLNTLIGAVPGALPPVIGWVAVRGSFDLEIMSLFVVLFLWQVPHFLAIAWIYREEYGRAGLCMLPVVDHDGTMSARQMVGYCLALLPASLMPLLIGRAGLLYLAGAVVLGAGFLSLALAFWHMPSVARARGVLRASLIYLPALLALLLIDALPR